MHYKVSGLPDCFGVYARMPKALFITSDHPPWYKLTHVEVRTKKSHGVACFLRTSALHVFVLYAYTHKVEILVYIHVTYGYMNVKAHNYLSFVNCCYLQSPDRGGDRRAFDSYSRKGLGFFIRFFSFFLFSFFWKLFSAVSISRFLYANICFSPPGRCISEFWMHIYVCVYCPNAFLCSRGNRRM